MPQCKFGPLKVPKARRALKYAHGKEQNQQAVSNSFKRVIDANDGAPEDTALKFLRRRCHKRPYFRQLTIPCRKSTLQVFNDPIIIQICTLLESCLNLRRLSTFVIFGAAVRNSERVNRHVGQSPCSSPASKPPVRYSHSTALDEAGHLVSVR